jgi:hypothetical protein
MDKYMLLVREDLNMKAKMSKEDFFNDIDEMSRWVQGLAQSGNYVDGEPLGPSGAFLDRNAVLSDGPFIEAKEGVSGFITILAENQAQANSIAQTCPMVANGKVSLEIRPLVIWNDPLKNGRGATRA